MEVDSNPERQDASTDSIIEELKALAKRMLHATEDAQRRTRCIEESNSYGVLLSAIESSVPETNRLNGLTAPHYHRDPVNTSSVSGGIELEELIRHNMPASLNLPERRKDGRTTSKRNIYNPELDNQETSLSEKDKDEGEDADEGAPHLNRHKLPSTARLTAFDSSGDSEENVYDGVKTQVVFKAVDPVLYQEISGCTWLPEPLSLRLDTGETVEVDSEDETVDNDYMEDETKSNNKKVFRVPSFPFGGGVTEAQANLLSKMFGDSMRRCNLSKSTRPKYITKEEFINYEYEECATTGEARDSFIPKSPFEFVVEIEQEVVFDAVRAREERRREFRRLAEEGKAPVTMGSFNLRVIMDPLKTGFEEEKTFPIKRDAIVADRYQIIELLGKATFSRAVRCYDLHQPFYEDYEEEENGHETEYASNHGAEENESTEGKKGKESLVTLRYALRLSITRRIFLISHSMKFVC
ncbi:protein kinase [Trypanosoma conorhini]|uniref:Protein kinase n=1 Tax=Trypanosoma conorhini TaxID=83891 RepID=A0A3R7MIK0_9TRYP|nr:protein kinase [Trypanosoma conorhini]RNF06582.1 protein kinase [Trypanosoma conorhini]